MAAALSWFWLDRGFAAEGLTWLNRAIDAAQQFGDSAALARALHARVDHRIYDQNDPSDASPLEAADMWRRLGNRRELGNTLARAAFLAARTGDIDTARSAADEVEEICEEIGTGDGEALSLAHAARAHVATLLGKDELALSEWEQEWSIAVEHRNQMKMYAAAENSACTLFELGRPAEALARFDERVIPLAAEQADEALTLLEAANLAEDYAAVLAGLGRAYPAAVLLGAADADRAHTGMLPEDRQARLLSDTLARAREELGHETFRDAFDHGQHLSVLRALREAGAPVPDRDQRVD